MSPWRNQQSIAHCREGCPFRRYLSPAVITQVDRLEQLSALIRPGASWLA